MKHLVWLFLLPFVVAVGGCKTTQSAQREITQAAQNINTQDGVDKDEALVIAQQFLIAEDKGGNHDIDRGYIAGYGQKNRVWWVDFPSASADLAADVDEMYYYRVTVSGESGAVIAADVKRM